MAKNEEKSDESNGANNLQDETPGEKKAAHDEYVRHQALILAVESLKNAGHPPPVEVLSRAEKYRAYILSGKIS
jgi:hypothetical protein